MFSPISPPDPSLTQYDEEVRATTGDPLAYAYGVEATGRGETWQDTFERAWADTHGDSILYIPTPPQFVRKGARSDEGRYVVMDSEDAELFGLIRGIVDHLYTVKTLLGGNKKITRLEVSIPKTNLCKKMIAAKYLTPAREFDQEGWWCVHNGVLDIATAQLHPFWHGDLKFLHKLPVDYLGARQDTPAWDTVRASYPDAVLHREQQMYAALSCDFSAEMFHVLLGRTRRGKGTIDQVVDHIFGVAVSHTPLQVLGTSFGKARCAHARINLDREMLIEEYPLESVQFIKDVITHEGPIEVNEKHKPQYDNDFRLWVMASGNQAGELPQGADRQAFFGRLIADEVDLPQKKDPTFKRAVLAEADAVFTNLVLDAPQFQQPENLDEYITKVAELWDKWANPVQRVCKVALQKADPPHRLRCDLLWNLIDNALVDEHISIKFDDMKVKTTQALGALFHAARSTDRNRAFYDGITFRDDTQEGLAWMAAYEEAVEGEEGLFKPGPAKPEGMSG